jgi:nucleoside-diphosphate-sugar epimerase
LLYQTPALATRPIHSGIPMKAHDASFSRIVLTDLVEPPIPDIVLEQEITFRSVSARAEVRQRLLNSATFGCIYLLHGIMSGAAEANLDLGLAVNLESQIAILNILRKTYPGTTKVVYASVGAVYGPAQEGEVVSEKTAPMPQSSYGAQKLIIETLINDFS